MPITINKKKRYFKRSISFGIRGFFHIKFFRQSATGGKRMD